VVNQPSTAGVMAGVVLSPITPPGFLTTCQILAILRVLAHPALRGSKPVRIASKVGF
jgi:hypothetical protein